jgi:hypothetical protein
MKRSVLSYGSEVWTITESNVRITADKMRFLISGAEGTLQGHERTDDTKDELQINYIIERTW